MLVSKTPWTSARRKEHSQETWLDVSAQCTFWGLLFFQHLHASVMGKKSLDFCLKKYSWCKLCDVKSATVEGWEFPAVISHAQRRHALRQPCLASFRACHRASALAVSSSVIKKILLYLSWYWHVSSKKDNSKEENNRRDHSISCLKYFT